MAIPNIRWATTKDVSSVLEIERACFHDPWSEAFIYETMRTLGRHGIVAEWQGQVVGHLFYSIHKTHPQIDSVAVYPPFQRFGIGSSLTKWVIAWQKSVGNRRRVKLTIPEDNLGAQLFFRANGFLAIKVIRKYYEDPEQDGYVMTYAKKRKPATSTDSTSD